MLYCLLAFILSLILTFFKHPSIPFSSVHESDIFIKQVHKPDQQLKYSDKSIDTHMIVDSNPYHHSVLTNMPAHEGPNPQFVAVEAVDPGFYHGIIAHNPSNSCIVALDGANDGSEQDSEAQNTRPSFFSQNLPFEQIPYEDFAVQVKELCQLLWPTPSSADEPTRKRSLPKRMSESLHELLAGILGVNETEERLPQSPSRPERFIIEHLRGGSYNRVVGITIMGDRCNTEKRAVLRVPRWNGNHPDGDVNILKFVQKYVSIPVPEVIAHDFSENNPLKAQYVIQGRIPGNDLASKALSYPQLNHAQKKMFVEQFCQLLANMQVVQHPYCGRITSGKDDKGETVFAVSPFEAGDEMIMAERAEDLPFFRSLPFIKDFNQKITGGDNDESDDDLHHDWTPLYFIQTQFGRWEHFLLGMNPNSFKNQDGLLNRLARAANEMAEQGWLEYEYSCLTHYDLDPRNIMVDIQPDGALQITGILDWDLACFAPKFVACKPPMWIWNWKDGENENEAEANDVPPTEEQQELKELFEDLLGFDYTWYSFDQHYRLARKLFRFAMFGVMGTEVHAAAEDFLKEWAELRDSQPVGVGNDANKEEMTDGEMTEGDDLDVTQGVIITSGEP